MSDTSNTIGDIVLANSGTNGLKAFDILLQALQATDPDATGLLGAALDPNSDLTVFAPTDDAFINLAKTINPAVASEADAVNTLVSASAALSPSDDPTAFLKTVLEYHISPGSKSLDEIIAQHEISTLAGSDVRPNGNTLIDEDPDLANPAFVDGLTDLNADNGVVQVIDNVLSPYDITFADSDGGFIRTGRGDDAVVGSEAHDFISLGRGDDIANGGGGNDFIKGGRGDDLIKGGDGNDGLRGGSGNDRIEGGDGHDYLSGGSGQDTLIGGAGNDGLRGGRNDDRLEGGDGHDYLSGGSGDDTLLGGADNDGLRGGRGDDRLEGGDGSDHLVGGRGNDVLVGGSGDDMLKGGSGADRFVFNPNNIGENGEQLEGNDVIRDFNIGAGDKLVLDLTTFDSATLDAVAGSAGDADELELIDLLADLNPETPEIDSVINLSASSDGDLLIGHPAGSIELDGISADVDPGALVPAVEFLLA